MPDARVVRIAAGVDYIAPRAQPEDAINAAIVGLIQTKDHLKRLNRVLNVTNEGVQFLSPFVRDLQTDGPFDQRASVRVGHAPGDDAAAYEREIDVLPRCTFAERE